MAAQLSARNGRLGPRAVLVDGAGDQLLAGAALAGDQHRDVLSGDAADGLVDLAHGGAGADDGAVHVGVRRRFGDHGRLAHPPGHLQRLADHAPQLVQVERLEQVIVGALLHRLDGRVRRLGQGDEDDRDAGVDLADLLVDLQSGLVGQAQVEQNNVGRLGPDAFQTSGAGRGNLDAVTGSGKCLTHLLRDQDRVIIDEQHVGHDRLHLGTPGKEKAVGHCGGGFEDDKVKGGRRCRVKGSKLLIGLIGQMGHISPIGPIRPMRAVIRTARGSHARNTPHRLISYGVALLATAGCLLIRWPLWPVLGDAVPHMTFFPAVMIAAYFGGFWPGLLATLLSAVAANYFLTRQLRLLRCHECQTTWPP